MMTFALLVAIVGVQAGLIGIAYADSPKARAERARIRRERDAS